MSILGVFAFKPIIKIDSVDPGASYECLCSKNYVAIVWALDGTNQTKPQNSITTYESGLFTIRFIEANKVNYWTQQRTPMCTKRALKDFGLQNQQFENISVYPLSDILRTCGAARIYEAAKAQSTQPATENGGVCGQCGCYDAWAAYSPIYKEVRCYRHC